MAEYLNIGDKAPNFTLQDKDGNNVTLSDFLGKKVILYFYPKDSTPGCTQQAQDFRDSIKAIGLKNAVVLGVSKDSVKSHQNFASKNDLNFTILSDPEKEVINLYGAWQEKTMYGKKSMGVVRTTYIIDEQGNVEKVYKVSKVAGHVEKVVNEL